MARGRPKKADPKSKYVRIRMTEEEYGKLRTQAEKKGCTMSDVIRENLGDVLNEKV